MSTHITSVWGLISALENQMPLTVEKTQSTLGQRFVQTSETSSYVVMETQEVADLDGVIVRKAVLMLRPTLKFEDNSGLSLALSGACLGLPQVREHFEGLRLIQTPRGGSLEEAAVWASKRPWGRLTFAFKDSRPDCLSSVVFDKRQN